MAKTIYDLLNAQKTEAGYFPNDDDYSSYRQISNSYFLQKLSITIKDGRNISMAEVFQNMEVFEEIYSSAIHGTIDIVDQTGGFSKFMITGGEQIEMVICKSVEEPDILIDRNDLMVYQVTDMRIVDQKIMTYKLHFISVSAINAEKKRLYKTFEGERSIRKIIQEVYSEMASTSDLYLKIDESKCVIDNDFVCPGYTPLDAMDVLAKRAGVSGDYYLFYERLNKLQGKKHVFASLNDMKLKADAFDTGPDITLVYSVPTSHFTSGSASIHRVTNVSFVDNYNHLMNMMSGLYNSGIKIIDVVSRSYTDIKVNYQDEVNNSSLNSSNYFSNYSNFFPEQPGERIVARSTNDLSSNSGSWLKVDLVNSTIISMFRLIIDMPGSNIIGSGNYVTLALPSAEAMVLNIGAGIVPTDPYYTGKYLVTAVKHTFTQREYTKKIEISRIDVPIDIDVVVSTAMNYPI